MDRMKVERIIMGPENKIEFTGGTLYFGDHAVDVKSFEMMDFESVIDATDYTDSIIKIIHEPMEFTGTVACEVPRMPLAVQIFHAQIRHKLFWHNE